MTNAKLEPIEVGYQVYAADGGEEFGAIRDVGPAGRPEIVVYVENAGEFTIPLTSVRAVHSQKVLLDVPSLPDEMKRAIARAHRAEQPGL